MMLVASAFGIAGSMFLRPLRRSRPCGRWFAARSPLGLLTASCRRTLKLRLRLCAKEPCGKSSSNTSTSNTIRWARRKTKPTNEPRTHTRTHARRSLLFSPCAILLFAPSSTPPCVSLSFFFSDPSHFFFSFAPLIYPFSCGCSLFCLLNLRLAPPLCAFIPGLVPYVQ